MRRECEICGIFDICNEEGICNHCLLEELDLDEDDEEDED